LALCFILDIFICAYASKQAVNNWYENSLSYFGGTYLSVLILSPTFKEKNPCCSRFPYITMKMIDSIILLQKEEQKKMSARIKKMLFTQHITIRM